MSIRLRKWLIVDLCKPPRQNNSLVLENMSENLSRYLDSYENIILLGDFEMTPEDKNLQYFTNTFSLEHLINEPTYFKGPPSWIDLTIANRKSYFKNTCVTVTEISDFHKLTGVSLKSQILKASPKIKTYRNYKTFVVNRSNEDLKSKLDLIEKVDYPLSESIFIDVLNTHAPVTTKKKRANNHQFMTKAFRKAIMTRFRLKNAYLKTRNSKNWESYKKQRSFGTNLLKKSEYFCNLNIKELNDSKKFWKKIEPFFSDIGLETNKIILKEKSESILVVLLLLIYSITILSTLQVLWN